jgi:hypothetical protein
MMDAMTVCQMSNDQMTVGQSVWKTTANTWTCFKMMMMLVSSYHTHQNDIQYNNILPNDI